MQGNPLLSTVLELVNYSHIYLYDQNTGFDILNDNWLRFSIEMRDFRNNLRIWGNEYSIEDLANIKKEYGISREDFEVLYKTAKSLSQCLICPTAEGTPFRKLSLIFYSEQLDKIQNLTKKLQDLYDGIDEDAQSESYFITRDLGNSNLPKDIIQLPNPYQQIPIVNSSLENFINEVKSNAESPSMKSFKFSTQFKLLSTFSTDINEKGLDEEEVQELRSICSTLLIKGFLFNQVTIKLSQKEMLAIKSEYRFDGNDEEVQNFNEMDNLKKYFRDISAKISDFDDENLNSIYQKHSNDESTHVLKPLVEELIPYYKSLITSSGYAQLTYQVSNKYQDVVVTFGRNYLIGNAPNKFIINPTYIDLLPFVVVDPPNEKYKVFLDIFKECYRNLIFYFGCFFMSRNPDMPYLPEEMDEIEELDTLQNQKYYIINYMVSLITSKDKDMVLSFQNACLILSMLNWKVDIDSKEGKDLDKYFKELINNYLKKYDYSIRSVPSYFAKYIINTVNLAKEPLITSEMKEKLNTFSTKAIQGSHPDSEIGCCLIH